MSDLNENPTLRDFQKYVSEIEKERGFSRQGPLDKCLLLGEEVGELFKAVRKQMKMGIDSDSKVGQVSEELADILIYLCSLANRFEVDLETAFRDKEEQNKTRSWN